MSSLIQKTGYPPPEWLKTNLSICSAEEELCREATEFGHSISPHWQAQWNEFKRILQAGDVLWYFEHFPEPFSGAAGYCIVRSNVSITSITTKRA